MFSAQLSCAASMSGTVPRSTSAKPGVGLMPAAREKPGRRRSPSISSTRIPRRPSASPSSVTVVVFPSAGPGDVTTIRSMFPSRSCGSMLARMIRKAEAVRRSENAATGPCLSAREGGIRPTTG